MSLQEANSNPATACGGSHEEMVYPGGEVAFIMRMVEDSVRLGGRVHWCVEWIGLHLACVSLTLEIVWWRAAFIWAVENTGALNGLGYNLVCVSLTLKFVWVWWRTALVWAEGYAGALLSIKFMHGRTCSA